MKGWCITRDLLPIEGCASRVGFGQDAEAVAMGDGPLLHRIYITEDLDPAAVERPVAIRLYDDDRELVYEGVMSADWLDGDEELAFAPLEWAKADAGCTELMYLAADGEWRAL